MKIRKWVDFGQEVEVEINVDDIRGALAEIFAVVTEDRLGMSKPNKAEVIYALNSIGTFLRAVTDEQIAMLNEAQRKVIFDFLQEQSARYSLKVAGRL